MDSGIVFYIPGALLLVAAGLKLSAGTGLWRDSLVAPSNAILLVGAAVCVLSAPPTIRYVNDATGVVNFSAPLVYAGMTALSASYLVLMIRWKGGSSQTQQRSARLVLGVYALVIAGIWVLFGLAEVPVERTQDLDTYYANTPCMREMIVLYMVAHTAATVALAVMSVSWLREVRGVTRAGLILLIVGLTFDAGYQIAKYTAMAARWNGVDWDFLSTNVSPPLVMLAGVTTAVGFAVPRVEASGGRQSARVEALPAAETPLRGAADAARADRGDHPLVGSAGRASGTPGDRHLGRRAGLLALSRRPGAHDRVRRGRGLTRRRWHLLSPITAPSHGGGRSGHAGRGPDAGLPRRRRGGTGESGNPGVHFRTSPDGSSVARAVLVPDRRPSTAGRRPYGHQP
nr:hypothetical protein [Streptomyces sp. RLB1-33]QIY75662.1 hypothetical protein HEP84_48270 [Streptomyces sp. RLB1-33]